MKVAVVTYSAEACLPKQPSIIDNDIDYHLFVDQTNFHRDIPGWHKHKILNFTSHSQFINRRNAKIYKVVPHLFLPNYDYYICLDSTHTVNVNPKLIIEKYLNESDIAVFRHKERDCVYDEGAEVSKIDFDNRELVERQLIFYKEKNYPVNNGLYELSARIQKNTEITQRLGLKWWEQICMFSSRDQISFPFCCYQLNLIPSILPGRAITYGGNDIFPQIQHSHHHRAL
jgi:hypothetical protein